MVLFLKNLARNQLIWFDFYVAWTPCCWDCGMLLMSMDSGKHGYQMAAPKITDILHSVLMFQLKDVRLLEIFFQS